VVGAPNSVANVFDWTDSQTVRIGAEYRILHDEAAHIDRVPLRIGYVYDTQTANARYPTAFGTPPGPTQVFTLGSGYNGGLWQTNVAYAYRFGHGSVSKSNVANSTCAFCSYDGDYSEHSHNWLGPVVYAVTGLVFIALGVWLARRSRPPLAEI
jgi:hypothetical protein